MAYFNPQPVAFSPSPSIMQGMNAIGEAMKQLYLQNYQENQDALKQEQSDQLFNIQKTRYENDINKVRADAAKAYYEASGKAAYVKRNDHGAFNDISAQYQNDPLGLNYALSGYASKMPAPIKPEGTFKTGADGALHYVGSNGTIVNLGLKMPQSESSNASTSEIRNYQMYADSLKQRGMTAPTFSEFYDKGQNAKTFGTGLRDFDEMQNRINTVANKYGIRLSQLSNFDFSKLSPEARYEFGQIVSGIEQSQKDKIPDWAKKDLTNLSQVVNAGGEIGRLMRSNDSGLMDNALNQVNQFLGLGNSAELARQSMSQSAYALYRNHMLKTMSGTAVSGSEEARFTQAFGDLWRDNKAVAAKLYENMGNLKARLQTIKDSYNPIAFQYRYGDLMKGVDSAIGSMYNAVNNNQAPAQQTVTTRKEVIDMLRSKGATSEQIDAYLQMKGL